MISLDISVDTLRQCVPDNLYPCLMCDRKFGSSVQYIEHDHMGMSAGTFQHIRRPLRRGDVCNNVPFPQVMNIIQQNSSNFWSHMTEVSMINGGYLVPGSFLNAIHLTG